MRTGHFLLVQRRACSTRRVADLPALMRFRFEQVIEKLFRAIRPAGLNDWFLPRRRVSSPPR